ncbi:hypothetical protein C8R45DRAFT_254722 [Mycena sanguinolenta]|nr:hypothetical protein C8R45DRAFT_254722 [Mycena sanguinolenta]
MLAACAITMKCFVINSSGLTSIPILPSVLEAEFKIYIDASRKLPAFISSSLSRIVSSLPLVETLTLIFTVEPLFPEVEWADEDPLPIFGAAFKNRTQLLHLRRVNCRLIQGNNLDSRSTLFDHFMRAMELRMPGLEGTGILTCVLAELEDLP